MRKMGSGRARRSKRLRLPRLTVSPGERRLVWGLFGGLWLAWHLLHGGAGPFFLAW